MIPTIHWEKPFWKWFFPCFEIEIEWEEAFPWP
jgi:hypothetical protein